MKKGSDGLGIETGLCLGVAFGIIFHKFIPKRPSPNWGAF